MQKPKIEQPMHAVDGNVANSVVSRRAVLQAAAWTLPAVAIAVGSPALAASLEDPPVAEDIGWYWSQFQVGADGNRTLVARTQMNLDTRGGTVPPFTAFLTVRFEVFRDSELTSLLLDRTETFEYAYAGTNGEASPDGLIRLRHEFTAEEWPPYGANLWVRFTMLAALGVDGDGNTFAIERSAEISHPNPSAPQTGYVGSQ